MWRLKRLYPVISIAFIIILSFSFLLSSAFKIGNASQPVILKLASAAMGSYTEEEQRFADNFNARTGGEYKIVYYPSEQMVKFPEILDAVRTGTAEMGVLTPNAYSADDPRLGAVELPFLFNNVEANAYAAPLIEPIYNQILEEKFNQKLLCLHHYTGLELFSTKPVKTLEDWKGLLVQALSPTCSGLITALGASAVSIPYTESYSSLEKGVVDAVLTAPAAAHVFKLSDVTKYVSTAYYISASHGFSINLDAWNSLPENIQDILVEEAQKTSKIISDVEKEKFQKDIEAFKELGLEVYAVPQAERDRWRDAASSYFDQQLKAMGDVGQKVIQIAEEANSKYP